MNTLAVNPTRFIFFGKPELASGYRLCTTLVCAILAHALVIFGVSFVPNDPPKANAGADQELCENFTNLNGNTLESGQTGSWSIISGNAIFQDINGNGKITRSEAKKVSPQAASAQKTVVKTVVKDPVIVERKVQMDPDMKMHHDGDVHVKTNTSTTRTTTTY